VCVVVFVRVVKAAAAGDEDDDEDENSPVDNTELTSVSSSHKHLDSETSDPQTGVPNVPCSTSDSIADDVIVEPHSSSYTQSTLCADPEPLEADTEAGSPATDSSCNNAAHSVEILTEVSAVDTSSEDEVGSDPGAVSESSALVDVDETETPDLSTVITTADVQYHNHLSSCNELSSSLTDSLDICEQGAVDADGCGWVLAVDSKADTETDSLVPTSKYALTPCQCSDNSSADTEDDDYMVESLAMAEDSNQCHCDVSEPDDIRAVSESSASVDVDESKAELEADRLSSDSKQMLNSLEQSSTVFEEDTSMSAVIEASGDVVDMSPATTLNVPDHDTPALTPPASEISSGVEMETGAGDGSSPVTGANIISSGLESDCEPGGKASKLDQPLATDCSDTEPLDTGALHMSVGFQSSPCSEKVTATFEGDSRDTSIGVLMLCDDDGIASVPVSAEPSVIVSDYSEAGCVASSTGEDYSSVISDAPSSFTAHEAVTNVQPSETESSSLADDVGLTECSSEAVAAEDVMLCEVESKSHEMDELLTDVAQTIVNTSHAAQLSDTSIFSHDESKFHYHLLTRRS